MRIAIVGSGIAGLAAAHALAGAHDVTLYEAGARPGGHVYTVDADGHAIDMGFIVHNRARYPRFSALLDELAIATRPTTMAFSVAAGGVEWGSASLSAMFADRRRLADPSHWRFLGELFAFLRRARSDLASALVADASLDGGIVFTNGPDTERSRTTTFNETVGHFGVGGEWRWRPDVALRFEWERFHDVGKAFQVGGTGTTGEADTDLASLGLLVRF